METKTSSLRNGDVNWNTYTAVNWKERESKTQSRRPLVFAEHDVFFVCEST